MYKVLAINPGSTSTKIAVYEDEKPVLVKTVEHDAEILNSYKATADQVPYRKELIESVLKDNDVELNSIDIVMCRGGIVLYPQLNTGGYEVNDDLYEALSDDRVTSPHASQLGGLIGRQIADKIGVKAYIYDAVTAGTLPKVATITGLPDIERKNMCHVLNSRAMGIAYSKRCGVPFEELNLLVAHMGGGCTVSAYMGGKLVECIADDQGHFSPERSGVLPSLQFIDLCYSGKYTRDEIWKRIRGKGGIYAHLGTSDCRVVEKMIESGDKHAELIFEALAYQIAKSIGLISVAFKGKTDAIIITGGVAYSKHMTNIIKPYVDWIAPVVVMPGEFEMDALALGGLRILKGEEKTNEYVWPEEFKHR